MLADAKSRVYVLLDSDNRVTRIEGEYTLPEDLTGWLKIDEGFGDEFALAQVHYTPKPLKTSNGLLRYRWSGDLLVERTAEDLEEEQRLLSFQPLKMDSVPSMSPLK